MKDGMSALLDVPGGVEGMHYMSLDILGLLFTEVVNQDQTRGDPYQDPKHTTAERWKAALDKFKDETMNRLLKHMDSQVFLDGQVLPGCLRASKYFWYAFPIGTPLVREPIPLLPALSSAAIQNSVPWPDVTGGVVLIGRSYGHVRG